MWGSMWSQAVSDEDDARPDKTNYKNMRLRGCSALLLRQPVARRHANDGVGSIRLFPIQRSEGEKPDQNVHPKQAAVRLSRSSRCKTVCDYKPRECWVGLIITLPKRWSWCQDNKFPNKNNKRLPWGFPALDMRKSMATSHEYDCSTQ